MVLLILFSFSRKGKKEIVYCPEIGSGLLESHVPMIWEGGHYFFAQVDTSLSHLTLLPHGF